MTQASSDQTTIWLTQDAFDKLRRASNSRNVKLRVLAAGMVAGLNGSVPRAHFDPS